MASLAKTIEMHRRGESDPIEAPVNFYVFDIESMNPSEAIIAAEEQRVTEEFLENWEPPENYKDPEKIEEKKQRDLQKKVSKVRERAALMDESPVMMIGLMFAEETMILHGCKRHAAKWLGKDGKRNRVSIEGFSGEKALMEAAITTLDARIRPDTMGVGHNIYGFDLPKLRLAAARNDLRLPDALRVKIHEDMEKPRMLDTMHFFCRYFARSGQMMIKASVMQRRLGLAPLLEGVADGKDVPKMLADGKVEQVAIKLFADLVGCRDSFLRMVAEK